MTTNLTQRTDVHMAFAFVMMGGWGLFANWGHPMPAPLVAALVQGLISAVITFALKRGLDGLRQNLGHERGWWLPPLVMCCLSLGALVALHLLARTPEILATILLPFLVSTSYAIIYNSLRWRKEHSR